MPRFGRVVLPGYPHHIIQRGHNRQVVFAEEADCRRYLDTLMEEELRIAEGAGPAPDQFIAVITLVSNFQQGNEFTCK